ncbi:MAG: ATP synthase F1 subunit gamma [Nitrospirota bacterium]|jgi:F-type H+-transporting ATPase subunit gamma
MATLRDIQRRIRAVKNTRQITSAMKMVAAAKLRRAQTRMMDLRPYADKMGEVISSLSTGADLEMNPLLAKRPPKVLEVMVITSDRGLCGAFNTNVMKAAQQLVGDLRANVEKDTLAGGPPEISITTLGKKARDYYRRRNISMRKSWTGLSGRIDYASAQEIAADIIERYTTEAVDGVYLVYNMFVNVAVQQVTTRKVLPVEPPDAPPAEGGLTADFIFEPSEEALFDALLPKNVEIQIFRAMLESQASEEAARMTAMENATKSANEMIETLTLQYNKARQAAITAELMDIVGGVEALKE